MKSQAVSIALSAALLTGGFVGFISPARAAVPENVQKGITDATDTVGALNGLALAALVVALTPLGAMLTLRFLNMVLSRV